MKGLFDINGRVAVVTGGAGYLGKSMCEALAEYGAHIVVASRDKIKCSTFADELSEKYGVECCGHNLDIRNPEDFKRLYKDVNQQYGRIDIVVNNAFHLEGRIMESISYEEWNASMEGTINAVFSSVNAVLPYMKQQHYGKIINISSMYGVVAPNPDIYIDTPGQNQSPAYGTGKAAIVQFTKYIAAYYANDGIYSNAICPGSFPHKETQKNAKFTQRLADRAMLRRIGEPEELKGIVLLLASDASSYMTGQAINVDGGVTSW